MTQQELYILLADITLSLQEKPKDAGLLFNRAKVYFALNDLSKALEDLDSAIAADGSLARAYMLRGRIYFKLHNTNAAYDDLRKATSLDPGLTQDISGEYEIGQQPKVYNI